MDIRAVGTRRRSRSRHANRALIGIVDSGDVDGAVLRREHLSLVTGDVHRYGCVLQRSIAEGRRWITRTVEGENGQVRLRRPARSPAPCILPAHVEGTRLRLPGGFGRQAQPCAGDCVGDEPELGQLLPDHRPFVCLQYVPVGAEPGRPAARVTVRAAVIPGLGKSQKSGLT
ncbi:hypothetical protein GCM10010285_44680 [Streptomyces pseudogriseolus]|uniref:Uncharacterized protein n=1 Tax=Streptomyces pseudogriseolus TaxID=36817 RepID=A0ABQ2TCN3_STREZ|nr:hypothetical protein GCM10010285_44680 [Streptomyces rubiginosus]